MIKKYISVLLILSFLILPALASCNKDGGEEDTKASITTVLSEVDPNEVFGDDDKNITPDKDSAVSAPPAENGSKDSYSLEITQGGSYTLSGEYNGSVLINAPKEEVTLLLSGASIKSEGFAAIYILKAKKVYVVTDTGSENTVITEGEFILRDENNVDGAIFSKADLTMSGEGKLTVAASSGHGIVSKDTLLITGGDYDITSSGHAISAKDSIGISSGRITLNSEKDGIHSENSEDTTLGYVYIEGGSFDLTSDGDGISASGELKITGGSFNIKTGDGGKSISSSSSMGSGFFYPGYSQSSDSASIKALKSGKLLTVSGGTFQIDSEDDAIHSNGDVVIEGGSFDIYAGDDGIHADNLTAIRAGTVNILTSYEGVEGLCVEISGGDIGITASDDGINAAGGNDQSGFGGFGGGRGDMFTAQEGVYINISGGSLNINASGDGIDSNGDLHVSGGDTLLFGPTNSGNGSLDFNGSARITGGTFRCSGASGMAECFGGESTQGVIFKNTQSMQKGSEIALYEGDKLILSFTAEKSFSNIVISSPEIEKGKKYTLKIGTSAEEIEMTELVYGYSGGGFGGGGMGGMPGGMGGGMGGKPGGRP